MKYVLVLKTKSADKGFIYRAALADKKSLSIDECKEVFKGAKTTRLFKVVAPIAFILLSNNPDAEGIQYQEINEVVDIE